MFYLIAVAFVIVFAWAGIDLGLELLNQPSDLAVLGGVAMIVTILAGGALFFKRLLDSIKGDDK